jgi:DNA-binding LacI/PurR family transcriptional regulator
MILYTNVRTNVRLNYQEKNSTVPPRITLKEVAQRAGVSYQTVSKVLNRQVRVTQETELRIMAAVRELGYRPNLIARNMRIQRSHLIGYSWAPAPPDNTNFVLDQFLQSMAQSAESAGYHLLCFPHHSGQDALKGYRELLDASLADAFVISGVEYNDPRIHFLHERQVPFVAFGRSNAEYSFPFVDVDGALGMRLVTEHLISQGHQRIGVLAWQPESRVGQDRMQGYRDGLLAAGIEPDADWVQYCQGTTAGGRLAAHTLLALPEAQRPTALAAFSDVMAIGAVEAVRQRGFELGSQIAVTGFDDTPLAQYFSPALTSVRQPIWEVGQRVMNLLLGLLGENVVDQDQVLLVPQLVIRQSSLRVEIVRQP